MKPLKHTRYTPRIEKKKFLHSIAHEKNATLESIFLSEALCHGTLCRLDYFPAGGVPPQWANGESYTLEDSKK